MTSSHARTSPPVQRTDTAIPGRNSESVGGVAAWLVEQIRDGHFKPGDQLASERQLCEQFSVSRPVIREALSQLRAEGLINVRQGRGAFVAEARQRQVFRLAPGSLVEKSAQAHVLELLLAIEVSATKLAAARRTEDDLRKIRRALVGMEYAIVNDQLGDEEDFAFHQAIADATYNPHFRQLSEHLEHSVRGLIRQARSHTADLSGELVKAVQDEHKAIFDAIVAGDPEAAGVAAETHLRNAAARLATYLDAAEAGTRSKTKRRRGTSS
jgi:DNA-binding FadR family transcriptional regulator